MYLLNQRLVSVCCLVILLLNSAKTFSDNDDDLLMLVVPVLAAIADDNQPSVISNTCAIGQVYDDQEMPCVDVSKQMTPKPGSPLFDVVPQFQSIEPNDPPDGGAFRLPCGVSHMSNNDPIVFPNQEGVSHHHTFFGNVGADHTSTAASIRSSGNSTCDGGIANRSAYWVPSMIDTTTQTPLTPTVIGLYYKTERSDQVSRLPVGLRMIAKPSESGFTTDFACRNSDQSEEFALGEDRIPECSQGNQIVYSLNFFTCWDGENLDSPDHSSHVTFGDSVQNCPASHPVRIPNITFNVHYDVGEGGTTDWRLASDKKGRVPGSTIHGDWMNGWDEDISNTFVDYCLKPGLDCNTWSLGDGRSMRENNQR